MSMVGLESIKAEPVGQADDAALHALMSNHLEHDAPRLYRLIERHGRYTGSTRAKEILARWDHYLPKFVKVMPVDYSKSLKILAASRHREADENTSFKIGGAKAHG
jgi:glutamate synthase (NADPH/NADH) large chain